MLHDAARWAHNGKQVPRGELWGVDTNVGARNCEKKRALQLGYHSRSFILQSHGLKMLQDHGDMII